MDIKKLIEEARCDLDALILHRRHLHGVAEVGFDLKNTVKYVKKELESLGYSPKDCGKCGVTADIGEGESCVLLRADMDALPIHEETGLSFAAKNGNMHACGHDMHTAMLLGAAKLIKAHESELCCRVRLMFQPAEEILSGAVDMIEDGALESVRAAVMIHVASGLDLPAGCVILPTPGIGAPSSDHFSLEIFGRGAHGATPSLGVDAVLVGAHILLGFSSLCARELSIAERAVLTVGKFDGGEAANAIADRAVLAGTLRAFDENVRERLKGRIGELARLTAKAHRAEAAITFFGVCPSFLNNAGIIDMIKNCAENIIGKENVFCADAFGSSAVGGSEDFAYVSRRVPTAVVSLTAGEKKKGYEYPLHHPKVKFDESALPVGAALFSGFALNDF